MALDRNIMFAAAAAGVVVLAGGGAYYWKNQRDIRNVDFRNGSVEIFGTACADPDLTSAAVTTIPLHDGAYQLGKYQFELVGDVKYGDVSGQTNQDSGDKAVFVGSCNSGGTTSQVLFVYGTQDGKLTRLATADLSNGGSSVVQSYSIANGAIQIRENQGTPPQLVNASYALLGGQLQNVGGNGAVAPTQVAQNTTNSPAAATAVSDGADDTSGDDKISFQYFHDQLTPYGQWEDHPRWGQVWRPKAEPADFRPYRDGHWENTDEYGMTWVANSDYGDIVYHYGRWAYDPDPAYHWMWVPDYTWAPSWVVWRAGEGHVGWLPMPPGDYEGEGDYADAWPDWYGYRDWYGDMAAEDFYNLWSFVPVDDLFAVGLDSYFVGSAVYGGFIGRIPGWTRYGVFRGHVVDRSFDRHRFEAAFHRHLPVSHNHSLFHHHVPKTSVHGGTRIAAHEHQVGHGVHTGLNARAGHEGIHGAHGLHEGVSHHGIASTHGFGHHASASGFSRGSSHRTASGFGRSGGFSRGASHQGFARSNSAGGFSRSGHGFSRSPGGFARSGMGSGYARSGSGGGFSRGGGGFGRSGSAGQSGFARSGGFGGGNRSFGGGGFGGGNRSFGGGGLGGGGRSFGGGGQRASTPHFGGNSGGGNHHHGH